MQDIINGRCGWCGTDELYVKEAMKAGAVEYLLKYEIERT